MTASLIFHGKPMAITSLYRGKFLEYVRSGKWEYVRRERNAMPVGILAVTPEDRVILISQYRVPVEKTCIEIPAGLVGDGNSGESWQAAAIRELREETGYTAADMELLTQGPTSQGLTSECMIFARAIGVRKAGAPEPDGDEQIEVHEVPVREVPAFLKTQEAAGRMIDPKIFTALYFLMSGGATAARIA
jgi:ADP-ribose pyrophosphatase